MVAAARHTTPLLRLLVHGGPSAPALTTICRRKQLPFKATLHETVSWNTLLKEVACAGPPDTPPVTSKVLLCKGKHIFTHYKKIQLLCNFSLLKVREITPLQQEINK